MYAWLQLPPKNSCRHAAAPDEQAGEHAQPVHRRAEESVVSIVASIRRRRTRAHRSMRLATLFAVFTLVGLASSPPASAASWSAHGSAEQVYVIGLAPNASASLLTSSGSVLYTQ